MYATLESMKAALSVIETLAVADDGEVSCSIGFEPNISPSHYPMIRLELTRIARPKGYNNRTAEVMIIFGEKITTSQGIENVTERLLDMEKQIDDIRKANGWVFLELIANPKPFEAPTAYKLMGMLVEVTAAATAPPHRSTGGLSAQGATVAGVALETPV